ncbi:hypothetical protein D3H65_12525 [Paraflavitalea soli]|uniref:Uncharacterized protein n=1 Tax=Paraflavitalea soli TaxID=2315862 RepID=A0A3B7MM01_9BACT|nr:hypothetical protein [Paraflavitalea soli]AXY74757.1 hypothetical protein D3H65_12525 [Paraflavitalea soli]
MKRVKIMLSAILVMAVVAGALAFKAKKIGGFCLYKTTLTTTKVGDPAVQTCKTFGQYFVTPVNQGGVKAESITTTLTLCGDVPTFTPTSRCVITLTTIEE